MRLRRSWLWRLLWSALAAVIAYVCLSAIVGAVFAEGALHLPRKALVDTRFVQDAADNLNANLHAVSITAGDDVTLKAWYAEPRSGNGESVLLLHGMGDNRAGVAGYGKLFLTHGYRVLLPDSRAHGESGGAIATYGVLERDDIRRWAEWLRSQPGSGCVYGFGESMGAALILQSLARRPPLCAVVAESPFATFRQIAYDRVSSYAGLGSWFGRTVGRLPVAFALIYGRIRYGVDLADADPRSAIEQSQVPVLLIHGSRDTNIPPRHSRLLYAAAASHASLWIVSGAEHTGAWATAPTEFEKSVLDWFRSHHVPPAR